MTCGSSIYLRDRTVAQEKNDFHSIFYVFMLKTSLAPQCCVYMDQPVGCGGWTEWLGAGGLGPGAPCHQCGPGGAPPHRGGGGHRGPRGHPHQLQRREAENAPARLLPGRPTGSHLCGLQHVKTLRQLMKIENWARLREQMSGRRTGATPVLNLSHTHTNTTDVGMGVQ